jgi:hypothetical protein
MAADAAPAAALLASLAAAAREQLGFAVQPTWLAALLPQLCAAHAGFSGLPRSQQLQLLLAQLLLADLRQAGAGGLLPADLKVWDSGCGGSRLHSGCCRLQSAFTPAQPSRLALVWLLHKRTMLLLPL